MRLLRDVPIRTKLARITQFALAAALGTGTVILLAVEFQMYRSAMTTEMRSMADVIGTNSRAALAFRDRAAGERTLAALGADPRIMAARLYTQEGRVFATYRRSDVNPDLIPAAAPADGLSLRARSLTLVQPIRLDAERIGTIWLQFGMATLYNFLLKHALIVIAVLGFASLAALALSSRLQGMIAGPVAHLAQMVKVVTERYDYSARAIKSGQDELGLLTDGFNEMLARIQERDAALQQAREELEERVALRTHELQLEIAERRRAEETLRKLSSAVEQASDSIFITDREGVIEYVNPAFERLTGYSRDEAVGRTPRLLKSGLHDQQFYERLWTTILSSNPFRAVFINRKKDRTLYYDDKTLTPLTNSQGQITHFLSAGRDITERMQAEEALRRSREQLRALAAHLESVREDERTRIAREIHDELGQMLTGLKFDLSSVAARLPHNQAALLERMQAMEQLIGATIQSVQRISTELRPGILDRLGLVAAMKWQTREFQTRTGIRCQLDVGLDGYEPDRETSTTLFRILQEALTNVVRHAGATAVDISLILDQDRLILAVVDNGRGITGQEMTDSNALGLLGMRERALLFGGEVTITGSPKGGTTVMVTIPLQQPTSLKSLDTEPVRAEPLDTVRPEPVEGMNGAQDRPVEARHTHPSTSSG